MWLSTDPALGEYIPGLDKDKNKNLPGMGGLFNQINANLFHAFGNNPIKYTDPDGREDIARYDIRKPTPEQLNKFTTAKNSVKTNLNSLVDTLNSSSFPEQDNRIVKAAMNWLGLDLDNTENINKLSESVKNLIKGIDEIEGFKMDYGSVHEKSYGYVKTNYDKIIYGGGRFDNLNDSGNDVFEGLIIHEISHRYVNTSDIIMDDGKKTYGLTRSYQLQESQKALNADNWEYFYEFLYTGGAIDGTN